MYATFLDTDGKPRSVSVSNPFPISVRFGANAAATTNNAPGGVGATGATDKLAVVNYNQVLDGAVWRQAGGDNYGNAFVSARGALSINTGQAAVTTSASLVVAARPGRSKVTLTPTSATVFYVGGAGVTTGTGLYVAAGGAVTIETMAAVYAVAATALTVSFLETF